MNMELFSGLQQYIETLKKLYLYASIHVECLRSGFHVEALLVVISD